MHTCEITLDSFQFPEDLDNDHANFRIAVGLRYVDKNNNLVTAHSVVPSPSTYWECDTDKKEKKDPRYVRAEDGSNLDMTKVGPWGRFMFRVIARELKHIKFEVYDVNRQGAWDTFKSVFEKIPAAFSGVLGPALPIINEVVSSAVTVSSGKDKLLFQGAFEFPQIGATDLRAKHKIEEEGKSGQYKIEFTVNFTRFSNGDGGSPLV